jgi:hypothetical protein
MLTLAFETQPVEAKRTLSETFREIEVKYDLAEKEVRED